MEDEIEFPKPAQEYIKSIGLQIEGLQTNLQRFVDGIVIGMGIDINTHNISVDLSTMKATITPKNDSES